MTFTKELKLCLSYAPTMGISYALTLIFILLVSHVVKTARAKRAA